MAIELDHLIIPAHDKIASAKLLAELLDVRWSPTGTGPFAPVFVNDGLTIDFDTWPAPIPLTHYCFRVSQPEFDAILGRMHRCTFRQSEIDAVILLAIGHGA